MVIIGKLLCDLSSKITRLKTNCLGPGEKRQFLGANSPVTQSHCKMDAVTVLTI